MVLCRCLKIVLHSLVHYLALGHLQTLELEIHNYPHTLKQQSNMFWIFWGFLKKKKPTTLTKKQLHFLHFLPCPFHFLWSSIREAALSFPFTVNIIFGASFQEPPEWLWDVRNGSANIHVSL